MRSYFFTFILTVLFIASTFTASFAQLPWTKYQGNPVLTPGPYNSWEDYEVYAPFVLKQVDTLKMWYTGSKSWDVDHIGYATSTDGILWQKHPANPVLRVGAPGSWDAENVVHSKIIFDGTTYHMWYFGSDDPSWYTFRLGYATSPDGINWTKADSINPVLDLGAPGEWDSATLAGASCFFDGNTFHMWYAGCDGPDWDNGCIGYATSTDGINWVKYPGNPVFCGLSSWDSVGVYGPSVIVNSSGYKMWYQCDDGLRSRIGYVTSPDGINWIPADSYVLDAGNPGNWDDEFVSHHTVLFDDTTYHMWYSGGRVNTGGRIGYATAPVTINVPGDLPTIQAAIDSAVNGNLILVADGTYQENINFKGKAITVASHYYIDGDTSHISNTVIDGSNPSNADSGSVVFFVSGEDTTSVLYGFTITNGSGTISEFDWQNVVYPVRVGGGILCYNSGARISDNKIMNNHIPIYLFSGGGGVTGYSDSSSAYAYVILDSNHIVNNTVTGDDEAIGSGVELLCNGKLINNVISHNTSNTNSGAAGAIICLSWVPRTVEIIKNQITHNIANGGNWAIGGGIEIEEEMNVSVIGNEISYNEVNGSGSTGEFTRGGGIHVVFNTGTTIIDRNTISNNMVNGGPGAPGGGIALASNVSNTLITNNILSGNSASNGGGINSNNSNASIINNTIVNNSATVGGGIRTNNNRPIVLNTIIWGNSAASGPQITGSPVVRYSNIQGGFTGTGNINTDPFFSDSVFNLADSSLCIGAGIDSIQISGTWYYAPPLDYDGDARPNPVDMYVDIGAQESAYPNPTGIIKEDSDHLPKSFSLNQNYPNPFNPTTNIEFSIPKTEFVTLKIFNILGQEVEKLVAKRLIPGNYKYIWDADTLASGVYLYKITAGAFNETRKMILLR